MAENVTSQTPSRYRFDMDQHLRAPEQSSRSEPASGRCEGNVSLIGRLSRHVDLDEEERKCLLRLENGPAKIFCAGDDLLSAGEHGRCAWLIRKGWATWHEILPNGSCQVFCFLLPGDVIQLPDAFLASRGGGLRGLRMGAASAMRASALTEVHAVPLDLGELRNLFQVYPDLMSRILASIAIDTWTTFSRHLINIGRRSARERLANLFIELWERQRSDRVPDDPSFALPVSQTVLADALGLTSVHISRVLTQLTGDGVLSIQKRPRAVIIHDLERLFAIAGIATAEEKHALDVY